MFNQLNRYLFALLLTLNCLVANAINDEDTAVANRFLRHAYSLHYSDPDSAIYYYKKILTDSIKVSGYRKGQLTGLEKAFLETLIRANNHLGNIHYYNDEFHLADTYYARSLDIARTAGLRDLTGRALYDLGYVRYVNSNYPEAIKMFGESYRIYTETGNQKGMFNAIQACGLAQHHLGNSLQSDSCYHEAYILASGLGDSSLQADVRLHNGILLCEMGNLEEGINYFEEALNYYERHNEREAVSLALLNIGVVMKMIGEYDKALSYIQQSTGIEEALQQKSQLVIRYYNLADLYLEMGRNDLAYDYCNRTLAIASEIGSRPYVAECDFLLGKYFFLEDDFDKAEKYFSEASSSAAVNHDRPLMANSRLWQARSCLKRGEPGKAIILAQEVDRLGADQQSIIFRKDAAEVLSEACEKTGRIKEALSFYRQFQILSDSLNYYNQHKEISRIEARYNFEKKEKENELLRNKASMQEQKLKIRNLVLWGLTAIVVLSIALILLLVRRSRDARLLYQQQQVINLKHLEELEQELDGKNRELTSKMMFLNQKNDMISRLIRRLQEIQSSSDNSSEEIVSLVNELRSDTPQSSWKEFEAQFIQVHPGFYQRLYERHPDLTSYEQRICAFLRMNLNTKEISSITGRSAKSIEVTRSRVRTKLKLTRDENLSSYLAVV